MEKLLQGNGNTNVVSAKELNLVIICSFLDIFLLELLKVSELELTLNQNQLKEIGMEVVVILTTLLNQLELKED